MGSWRFLTYLSILVFPGLVLACGSFLDLLCYYTEMLDFTLHFHIPDGEYHTCGQSGTHYLTETRTCSTGTLIHSSILKSVFAAFDIRNENSVADHFWGPSFIVV